MKTIINTTDILAIDNGKTIGQLEFTIQDNHMTIIRTVAHEKGLGIGTELMKTAVQFANEHHYTINPVCSFAKKYLAQK